MRSPSCPLSPEDLGTASENWPMTTIESMTQRGDELGERLSTVFEGVLSSGHERVVAIGADSPTPGSPGERVQIAGEVL